MAVLEQSALFMRKDASGNKYIIYPITNLDSVDGAETLPRFAATPTVGHLLRVAEVAEDGTITVDAIDGSNIAPIQYVESLDQDNVVNLRDLDSGNYILYGYFRPYDGASNVLTFSSQLLVGVIKKTAGTHVQVIYPLNNVIQFLEIMVDSTQESGYTYKRTDVKLSDLVSATTLSSELAQYLPLAGGTMNDADIDGVNALWLRNLVLLTDDDQELLIGATNSGETDPTDDSVIFDMSFETRTRMRNIADPVEDTDVATKGYVDEQKSSVEEQLGSYLPFSGGTMANADIDGINALWTRSIFFVADDGCEVMMDLWVTDDTDSDGNTVYDLTFSGYYPRLKGIMDPVDDTDAATKGYVDSAIAAALEAMPYAEDSSF